MATRRATIGSVDEWYEKWCCDRKIKAEDAKQAIEELEKLVESYCESQHQNND